MNQTRQTGFNARSLLENARGAKYVYKLKTSMKTATLINFQDCIIM